VPGLGFDADEDGLIAGLNLLEARGENLNPNSEVETGRSPSM